MEKTSVWNGAFSRWLVPRTARGGCVFGRVKQGDADVMVIATWKADAEGRWIKYDSPYETTQLLEPYAALLTQSEEAASALVVRFMAGVVVEFSRRVDGAFLQAPASNPSPRLRW